MLSCNRHRSLLRVFCAFIALLLMNGGAVISTHARADALLQGAAQRALLAHAASDDGTWQKTVDDASGSYAVLADTDDEPVLLFPLRISLGHVLSAMPLSASAVYYPAPVASLLRPPNLT